MTSGGFDHGAGPRSANLFSCQQNLLSRLYFAKVTVEDESRACGRCASPEPGPVLGPSSSSGDMASHLPAWVNAR